VLVESATVARVIDAQTGRVAARIGTLASTASAQVRDFGLEISPDRRTAVTRAPDGTARLWDLARGRGLAELGIFAVGQPAPSDKGPRIVGVAGAPATTGEFLFTPDGERLITDAIDGRLSIWDARTGRRVATIGQYAKGDHVSVAPDGSFALALLADGTATLWNTRSGWRIANLGHFSSDMSETDFLISPDQRLLLISDREKTELWDIERVAKVARRASPADILDAVFSDDSAWLVLRPNAEAAFEIWNARTGGRAGEARPADEATFYKVGGEDILLTRSAAGFAFWDLRRGERAIGCQFSDPGLSMMEIFAADDALSLVIDVGGGRSELWRLERT
jgi:WD40 repeat protein